MKEVLHQKSSFKMIESVVKDGDLPLVESEKKTKKHQTNKSKISQMLNVWYIYLHLPPKLPSFVGMFWPYIGRIWVWVTHQL